MSQPAAGGGEPTSRSSSTSAIPQSIDIRAIALEALESAPFPPVRQELRIYISEEAFDRAVARGTADTSREIGGVLVGDVLRDGDGPYVRVDTTIDALHAEEKGAELTFTHATWQHIHEQMDSVHQGKRLVGWYHTHPGFGVFLSDRDQFIHRSFFDLPFQVALVYDPKTREHGMFAWRDNVPVRCRRYFVGEREQLWDGAREATHGRSEAAEPRQVSRRGHDNVPEGERLDWLSLALFGALILMVGGLSGWYLGTRGAYHTLAKAETQLVNAQAKGARQAVQALNTELLEVVRASLDKESMRTRAADILTSLDRAIAALGPAAAPVAAEDSRARIAADLARVRAAVDALRTEHAGLDGALAQLRRLGSDGAPAEAESLAVQQSAMGTLLADLAADVRKAGDPKRAARYLVIAAQVDPGNHERYQRELRAFDKSTRMPAPGARSKGVK